MNCHDLCRLLNAFEAERDLAVDNLIKFKYIYIYIYLDGLKLRMTFWKSPGVSEKLPFRRAGPKSHVFELFFSFGKLRMSN